MKRKEYIYCFFGILGLFLLALRLGQVQAPTLSAPEVAEVRSFICGENPTGSRTARWRCQRTVNQEVERIKRRLEELGFRSGGLIDFDRFAPAVLEAERRYGVDHELLIAVAIIESQLQPEAVSNMGAYGLFQILPQTAEFIWPEFLQTLDRDDELRKMHPVRDIHDVRLSTLLGAFYLARLKEEFAGKMHLAVASYNVGPAALRKGMNEGRLPGSEYMFRVFEMANEYRGRTN